MRVLGTTLGDFRQYLASGDLFKQLQDEYPRVVGHTAAPNEANSWLTSLPQLDTVLSRAQLPSDVWVDIEETIPYYSQRIDVKLFGHDGLGLPHVVIVELKAWSQVAAMPNGNVETVVGGSPQSLSHPSMQARGYHEHLEDFCVALHNSNSPIHLSSCAYCYNYAGSDPDDGLFHAQFAEDRRHSPVFGGRDKQQLAAFLWQRLARGGGRTVVERFDGEGIAPSKKLIEHANEMIQKQRVFKLLDAQVAANNGIVHAIMRATAQTHKRVILVRGGPGTGKSVIALNAFGEALRKQLEVYLVTGSGAFTASMRELLGRRLSGKVRYTDFFWNFEPDSIDVMVVDEAHRIRTKSVPKVMGHLRPTIPQIDELIRASKVLVLFADENQIISPNEVGEPHTFRAAAKRCKAILEEFVLTAQFRCDGSEAYLEWLDDMLQLSEVDRGLKLATPAGFDFRLVDSPQALLARVQRFNAAETNSSRLLAGWCWPWSSPNADGSLVDDIVIGDFRFPWEAKNNSQPAPGIPTAKLWAIVPAGANQAGTVYSMQGFETKHAGVIFGPDLVVRGGKWVADPRRNFSNDLRGRSPGVALPYLKRIYRTLLSRSMSSCSVYCVDDETRHYLESRLIKA